ncbi:MAG: hypothetical protein Q9163_006213 [Psora crenata]
MDPTFTAVNIDGVLPGTPLQAITRYVNDFDPPHDSERLPGHVSARGPSEEGRGFTTAGLSFPKSWVASMEAASPVDRHGYRRRESSTTSTISNLRSPTDSERRYEASALQDEGYYSLSGPSANYQQLPGERQLHHRDQEKSSQAYDKNLLSKIGKPSTTPPRTWTHGGSIESSPNSVPSLSQRHPSQLRSLSFPNSASSKLSDPPIKQEPLSRLTESSRSRPISPVSASSTVSYMDYRSPTLDHSSRSSTIDSESFSQYPQRFPSCTNVQRQQKSRRSGSGSLLSQFDESAYITTNEVKRENYDQPIFSEHDSTFRMEETVRHLHLDDRTTPKNQPDPLQYFHMAPLNTLQPRSAKRKLEEAEKEQQRLSANNEPQPLSAHSGNQYAQHQAPANYGHEAYSSTGEAQKISQHQSEKQYSCIYCHNRFKNKNEAERHQNSLHRRLHSWSCAVLADDIFRAFFSSTSIPPTNASPNQQQPNAQAANGVATFDVCGYCGEEFTNEPTPNWTERQQHLTTQHKFGECNQTKKFFRADHFRQHLKHSHGGKSGKHTNSLEQACIRDEPPAISNNTSQSTTPTQLPSAPVANMGNLGSPVVGAGPMAQPGIIHAQLLLQQQQMSPQANMGPPIAQTGMMSQIDPNLSCQQHHHQQHQQQALQIPGSGGGGGGGG